MKKIFPILILLVVLFQILSKLVIFLNYEINKDYISKNLCENRYQPQKHCNGKCYLKKQLDREDAREQTPVNFTKEKYGFEYFSQFGPLVFLLNPSIEIEKNACFVSPVSGKHVLSVFHPPSRA